tara:strand:- start:250 stop:372 length:123 start_codon:yes stop_codon:yes gene_type:complete
MFDIGSAVLFLTFTIPVAILVMYVLMKCINASDKDRIERR